MNGPNIVIIVADAYRRDSNHLFNGSYRFTPRISERMRSWRRFPFCYSSASWTLPSCSSILSGIDSSTHAYFFQDRSFGRSTIAEYLGGRYYKVGVVNNGNLKEFSGLHRGFDEYYYFEAHDEPYKKAAEFLAHPPASRPYFLFFHTNIPHDYFAQKSHEYYRALYGDRDDWFCIGEDVISWDGLSESQRKHVRSYYDASVARMDERLSTLLDQIDLDRTIVCFLSDHGEGFDYERARIHHGGRLHDDLINVPLLMHVPRTMPESFHDALSAQEGRAVSTSDIMPTLLDLASLPTPVGLDGISLSRMPTALPRCLVSEDKRYLYTPMRERFNVNLKGKHTSWFKRFKNRIGQSTVARSFNVKAYLHYPHKLIITSYVSATCVPGWAMDLFGDRLCFSAARLLHSGSLTVALELYDLSKDPDEAKNLLSEQCSADFSVRINDSIGDCSEMIIDIGGARHNLGSILREAERM